MVLSAPLDRPLTYDDLVALPDDGKRYELIGGEIYEVVTPDLFHQYASGALVVQLHEFAMSRRLGLALPGPLDVRFDPRNVVQPDIVYVSREQRRLVSMSNFQLVDGAPDLLMEVLSPSNRGFDVIKKAALYATFGVREYWLVDPEAETIFVQVLRDRLFVLLELGGRYRPF